MEAAPASVVAVITVVAAALVLLAKVIGSVVLRTIPSPAVVGSLVVVGSAVLSVTVSSKLVVVVIGASATTVVDVTIGISIPGGTKAVRSGSAARSHEDFPVIQTHPEMRVHSASEASPTTQSDPRQ